MFLSALSTLIPARETREPLVHHGTLALPRSDDALYDKPKLIFHAIPSRQRFFANSNTHPTIASTG